MASELAGGRAGGVGAGQEEEQLGAGCVTRQSPGGVARQVLCAGAGSGCRSSGEHLCRGLWVPLPGECGTKGIQRRKEEDSTPGSLPHQGQVEEAVGEDSGGSWERQRQCVWVQHLTGGLATDRPRAVGSGWKLDE